MSPEFSPEDVARRTFRTAFRGYDPEEVAGYLQQIAETFAEIADQRDRLAARLAEFGARDLKNEFATIGEEVGAVLESARVAAESMRERATNDATQWRAEAQAAAERDRESARVDAENLRGDAWAAAEQMLDQVQTEGERLKKAAERDSLTIRGEAERTAHRMTSAARREADELLRTTRMDAERLTLDAGARHDEIVEAARRQADTAQERTRALEQRRQELLEEIESVRSILAKMEEDLSMRREALDKVPAPFANEETSSIKVVPSGSDDDEWDVGETIRVIRPPAPPPAPPSAEEMVDEVRRMHEPSMEESPAATSQPAVDDAAATEVEVEVSLPVEPSSERAESDEWLPEELSVAIPSPDDGIGDLFRRLRGPDAVDVTGGPPVEQPLVVEAEPGQVVAPTVVPERVAAKTRGRGKGDPFGLRESLLLPITNRALRSLKRQLTEEQNEVLERVRLEEPWLPSPGSIAGRLRADLVILASESFAAGHNAAEEMVGHALTRPPTPKREDATAFSEALLGDLDEQASVGHQGRQLANELSRVFRTWRTDAAERRIVDLAGDSYHRGLADSLGGEVRFTVSGRGCATCRAAAEDGGDSKPPLHPGCSCTLVPA